MLRTARPKLSLTINTAVASAEAAFVGSTSPVRAAAPVTRPRMSLSINTAVAAATPPTSRSAQSPLSPVNRLPSSPGHLSPTVINTRLNQRLCSSSYMASPSSSSSSSASSTASSSASLASSSYHLVQMPTYNYANANSTKSILKKPRHHRDDVPRTLPKTLQIDAQPTIYHITPIDVSSDYWFKPGGWG